MPGSQNKNNRYKSDARSDVDNTLTLTTKDRLINTWQQRLLARNWRLAVSVVCTTIAAGMVGLELPITNLWERQVQSLFFELRGPVEAPENVVILAIDEESLSQGQHYREDPERYRSLQPIESWPWRREAYAKVIDRLMQAGAQAVAIDVLFPEPSSYGDADDDVFAEVLSRYGDRVVLAADYSPSISRQGVTTQALVPLEKFEEAGVRIGSINFPLEQNEQIHRLTQNFLAQLAADEARYIGASAVISEEEQTSAPISFAQATLLASDKTFSPDLQENIFFHGPANTFKHLPFWYVLDDDPWQNYLKNGRLFEGKTVLIGTTATIRHDFHEAPFSQSLFHPHPMAGVEILANTVATLEQDISPTRLVKNPKLNALIVLTLGLSIAGLTHKRRHHARRILVLLGSLGFWIMISYGAFVSSQIILITGVPIALVSTMGVLDFGLGFTADRVRRKRLRTALARYKTSPLVQEIISQQDDFQDLLDVNRADLVGMLLRGRYRISEVLGAGGFGETYLAHDMLRPGHPVCVVKQLKIVSDNPKSHQLARRLFEAEAVVLGELGEHDQIPRLLAYFEVNHSFYLVQEMVSGRLLRNILAKSRPLSQRAIVKMLRDLLPVVSFVHSKGVIHRDIKPSNIIRRKRDGRYVLIDFGAVKTISNKITEEDDTHVTSTVGIGTQGYMPSEQSAGMPTVRSDIYALGITAIEALTGRPPHAFRRSDDGEIIWAHKVKDLSPELSKIISKMVRYDFNKRYETSDRVIEDLRKIEEQQLTDTPAPPDTGYPETANSDAGTTYNQGTRPGVIPTNPDLDRTQILPEDWLNQAETKEEPPSAAEDNTTP